MRLNTITKLSLVVVGLAAVTVFAQKTGDSMQAKRNNTNLYASEVREAYAQPVASVGSDDLLTITEVKKNHYRVRTVSGVEGFVQKNDVSKTAASKSRSYEFGDAHIEGYLTAPATVYIIDANDSEADPISLNRSFKEALKENTDKETIERLTIR